MEEYEALNGFTKWLEEIGLGQHQSGFLDQEIDFDIASDLTDQDLKELGLSKLGDRKRFVRALMDRQSELGEGDAPRKVPQGERRQVTVLFADIAGYTSLSSKLDPEEIHTLLNDYFAVADEAIRAHGGSIDKHIGDAVMAVFGAPVAHTDDPLRAVLAAFEIHEKISGLAHPLQVHIGIASGEVVASGTGSDTYQEYTVTGSTVNLASRLDGLADATETYVNEEVYRAVSDQVAATSVGEVSVKGFDQPVSVWSVAQGITDGIVEEKAIFIGRTDECQQFERVAESCLKNKTSKVFCLRGEPGIGKTTLSQEFIKIANRLGYQCHEAMILDFGSASARRALQEIALGLIAAPIESDGDKVIQHALEQTYVSEDQAVHLQAFLGLPLTESMRRLYDAMDNRTRHRGQETALNTLLRASCCSCPRLILIDNMHWANEQDISRFRALMQESTNDTVLFVITTRIEGVMADENSLEKLGQIEKITLEIEPLHETQVIEFAQANGMNDASLITQIFNRSGGNPLFLEQIFKSVESGSLAEIPGSLRSVVLSRMDNLQPMDRSALQAASIMGQRFSLELLRVLIGQPHYQCGELIRHALVKGDGDQFLFAHALVTDGVCNSLMAGQRQDLHIMAAEYYGQTDKVLHARHLDRGRSPQAAMAYHTAASEQVEAYQYEPALQLVERGLEIASESGERVSLTCLKGDVLLILGKTAEAMTVFEEAVIHADQAVDHVRARIGIGAASRISGMVDKGVDILIEAESYVGEQDLNTERAWIHYLRGSFMFSRGDHQASLRDNQKAIELGRKGFDQKVTARGMSGLGDAQYACGLLRTAGSTYEECVKMCHENGFGEIEIANRYQVLNMRRYMNQFKSALDGMPDVIKTAEQTGNVRPEMLARMLGGEFLTDAAQYGEAIKTMERSREIAVELGNVRLESYLLNDLARALIGSGQSKLAHSYSRKAWQLSQDTDTAFIGSRICGVRALLAKTNAEVSSALADGEKIIKSGVLAHNRFWFYRDAVDANLMKGNWDRAEEYVAKLTDETRIEPFPWADFYIERGQALVERGKGNPNREKLTALARQAREIGILAALDAIEEAIY